MLDGPGQTVWVKLALDHWWAGGGIPYWIGEMWAGTPAWGLAPTFPVVSILPLAALIGPEESVKLVGLAALIAGAWGAMALAHSLWKNRTASLVAGVVYGLHPLVVAHLALFGHEPSIAVMAATPWLIIAIQKALRGAGRRWIAIAGMLAAFCTLEMGEHIYGLLLLCALLFVMELTYARRRGGLREVRAQCMRAAGVGGVGLGLVAYWLLPLSRLNGAFVLTPPQLARYTLTNDIGARFGRQPDYFLRRLSSIDRIATFYTVDIFDKGSFYLSWVCIALTIVTVVVIARRRDNPTLSTILLTSLVALWTSTGGVAFAQGALAHDGVVPWLVIGLVSGLVIGGFLRHLQLGRAAAVAGIGAAVLLFAVPYLAPFLGVQSFIPLLANLRFPRLYPIAPLGLALGVAFPVTLVASWARQNDPARATLFVRGTAALILVAFLVDVAPYRVLFDLRPPDPTAGYRRATAALAAAGDQSRVASTIDPRVVEPLLDTGRDQSTGWPHPVASPEVLHLTLEALFTPQGLRDSALGLSSTGYYVLDPAADPIKGTGRNAPASVDDVTLQRNPKVLPVVRSYDSAVVVNDGDLAPDLAIALSQRRIGVVKASPGEAKRLGDLARSVVPAASACAAPAAHEPTSTAEDEAMSDEVATACAMNRWLGDVMDLRAISAGLGTGGTFTLARPGLHGISVWLDRLPGLSELVVREVGDDGTTLGPIVDRSTSSTYDENDMALFPLDPDKTQRGKRYAFLLSCPRCPPGSEPRLVQAAARDGVAGDLIENQQIRRDKVVAFGLDFDRVPMPDPSTITLQATRISPGHWRVTSAGDHPSLLVVGEAWFPGWVVKVDGHRVDALKADGAFLGVPLAAGTHHVTLGYDPPFSAYVGRVVSALALLVGIVMLLPWAQQWRPQWGRRRPDTLQVDREST